MKDKGIKSKIICNIIYPLTWRVKWELDNTNVGK